MKLFFVILFLLLLGIQAGSALAQDQPKKSLDLSGKVETTWETEVAIRQPGLIARGGNVDELDLKHEMFGKRLHKLFNEFDMGGNWQIAADYPWMPPLDISGEGLAVYKNAGKYLLEVDGQHTKGDFPSGDWVMLFNQSGDLLNDIYFGSVADRDSHIIFVGDMDHDNHLEWLIWGAIVLGPGRDKQNIGWMDIERKYGNSQFGDFVELYVMNEDGVLEYKRGSSWFMQYRHATEVMCPLVNKEIFIPTATTATSEADEDSLAHICLSAMEATDNIDYILETINRLQDYPRKYWSIKVIADELAAKARMALKLALEQQNSHKAQLVKQ